MVFGPKNTIFIKILKIFQNISSNTKSNFNPVNSF